MARYRDGYKGGIEKYDFSLKSISRGLLLLIIPFSAYTIGLFPIVLSLVYVIQLLDFTFLVHILLFTIVLVIEFFLFIVLETFIPGLFIRISHLKVDEGEHEISIKDWNFFKYSLYFFLYRPSLKLIGILPLLPLRIRFLKLVGLKMGKSSVLF